MILGARGATENYRLGNSDKTRTNQTIEPKMFVVYHEAAADPEYIIQFTIEILP